jgi:simple sugar transport system ATP-binding protein
MTEGALLKGRGLTKSFGHVHALRGVDFDVPAASITGLVGDNGAGKSTLIGVLSGVLRPDDGTILLDGDPISLSDPQMARAHGIETVYQDLALAPDLEPAMNIYLGREIVRSGALGRLSFIDRRAMRRQTAERLSQLGIDLPRLNRPVSYLSGGQRQAVAIARALIWARRILLLDEPTAALGVRQSRQVHDVIRRVRDQGVTVVLISHNIADVMSLSDRIIAMRLGRVEATFETARTTGDEVVAAITGASRVGAAA